VISRVQQLAQRRAELIARSTAHRDDLALHATNIGARLGLVDRGLNLARAATGRPFLLSLAGLVLMMFKPARALAWLARGALVTSLLRRLLGLLDHHRKT
jgi:hypothetical protein